MNIYRSSKAGRTSKSNGELKNSSDCDDAARVLPRRGQKPGKRNNKVLSYVYNKLVSRTSWMHSKHLRKQHKQCSLVLSFAHWDGEVSVDYYTSIDFVGYEILI